MVFFVTYLPVSYTELKLCIVFQEIDNINDNGAS